MLTEPNGGGLKKKLYVVPDPNEVDAGTPLTRKSAARTPLTGALKVTVTRSRDSTAPGGGSTETTSRAARTSGTPRVRIHNNPTMVWQYRSMEWRMSGVS
jgi:hypothetical protein